MVGPRDDRGHRLALAREAPQRFRRAGMRSARVVAVSLLAPLAGCWTYPTALAEFDSVTEQVQGASESEDLRYQTKVMRMPWVVRQLDWSGFDNVLVQVLAVEREAYPLDNPSGFARERIEVLPDLAGDDLHRIAEVATRLLWVANQDRNPLNQIAALRGLKT